MVHIDTVDLSSRNVTLPNDRVGMVVAQPYVTLSDVEPFQASGAAKTNQLEVVRNTLEVARAAPHGEEKTHFTIFPEYTIPGIEGIQLVQDALEGNDWPVGTIVIGGTDALTKAQFSALCATPETHFDSANNALDRIAEEAWINCKITWIKTGDGRVQRWLQPKLSPAWAELNVQCQQMFCGSSVYMFRGSFADGTQYRFCSLVCFDWIASVGGKKVWQWILESLHNQATQAGADFALSWFFVVQSNPKPSHDTFLSEVGRFFDQTVLRGARRDRACLIFANCAGHSGLGRAETFGHTSLIFPPQTLFADPNCSPTFSSGGVRFRASTLLSGYHDILFRERGACIHSFVQINPSSLPPGPAGRTIALHNAAVFPLNGSVDRRAPSAPVPASIKWLNDELDGIRKLSSAYPTVPLANDVEATHRQNVMALRQVSPQAATDAIKLATQQSTAKHPDEWSDVESEALENLVNTLNIISLGSPPPAVAADSVHATVTLSDHAVDLVAIRGLSHEDCLEHVRDLVPKPGRPMLIVSRDRDNIPWTKREGSILQTETSQLGQERRITDPESGLFHLGYQNILELFRTTSTAADMPGAINAQLAA